jgi:G:T-mismatch repair DNA endonuclease (very short patch repair protein)
LGWRSITVWECEVADSRALESLSKRIRPRR